MTMPVARPVRGLFHGAIVLSDMHPVGIAFRPPDRPVIQDKRRLMLVADRDQRLGGLQNVGITGILEPELEAADISAAKGLTQLRYECGKSIAGGLMR